MSYLHCHGKNCNWSQNDFWSKDGWNPFRQDILDYWIKILHEGIDGNKYIKMDRNWVTETQIPCVINQNNETLVDFREFLAYELERKAKSIRDMRWITYKEFKNDKNAKCPNCGSSEHFDID